MVVTGVAKKESYTYSAEVVEESVNKTEKLLRQATY